MFKNLTKIKVYGYLVGMFCSLLVISNILGTKNLQLNFIILPCSILTFPLAFIINKILSEIYGFETTKKVIYFGILINVIAVIFFTFAIQLPSNTITAKEFSIVLGNTPRLLIGGFCSYFISNIINSKIIVILKEKYPKQLFIRYILSTVVGETLDSIIFIIISFIGVYPNSVILTMIYCQTLFKIIYEILIYPITRKIILFIRKLDDGELKNLS